MILQTERVANESIKAGRQKFERINCQIGVIAQKIAQ